jgi:hypothetical protein
MPSPRSLYPAVVEDFVLFLVKDFRPLARDGSVQVLPIIVSSCPFSSVYRQFAVSLWSA